VGDDALEQLVEPVVDALVVERVSEQAGSVEQQLGDSGLPLEILGADGLDGNEVRTSASACG
jgi:hypothetical protein